MLILKVEAIYSSLLPDDTMDSDIETEWMLFLTHLAETAAMAAQTQKFGATIQSDVIKPLVAHFSRFSEFKSQQLLVVLTQEIV